MDASFSCQNMSDLKWWFGGGYKRILKVYYSPLIQVGLILKRVYFSAFVQANQIFIELISLVFNKDRLIDICWHS